MSKPRISFGVANIGRIESDVAKGLLDTLEKYQVKELDTANIYVSVSFYPSLPIRGSETDILQLKSEEAIGQFGAEQRFVISTKAPGFANGSLAKQSVLDGIEKSLRDLKTESVSKLSLLL